MSSVGKLKRHVGCATFGWPAPALAGVSVARLRGRRLNILLGRKKSFPLPHNYQFEYCDA